MALGDSLRLQAHNYDCHYDVCERLTNRRPVIWTALSNGISVSARGVLRARRVGMFRVRAVVDGVAVQDSVEVLPPVARLAWIDPPREAVVGDTLRLVLAARDSSGRTVRRLQAVSSLGAGGQVHWRWSIGADANTMVSAEQPGFIEVIGALAHRVDTLRIPVRAKPRVEVPGAVRSRELAAMFAADQSDRSGALTTIEELDGMSSRDSVRRERVVELMSMSGEFTARDYYHAAMVMQHGEDTLASASASQWASRAFAMDSTSRPFGSLAAAARDRHLMRQGRPQWYGTQFVRDGERGPWRLYPVDSTKVTDADRRRHGVRTLEEQRARAAQMNAGRPP